MVKKAGVIKIEKPRELATPTPECASTGPYIFPQDRIKLYHADEWEKFIQEWAFYLENKYSEVVRCAGAGDMGRDIIAYPLEAEGKEWINFQCKHYDHPLYPGDVWIEIGKLCYYTYLEEYQLPKEYYFVAPQASGPELSALIRSPKKLKEKFLENWDKKCKKKITSTKEIPMTTELKNHIDSIDFSIFKILSILNVIEQHRTTAPYHHARFGGGLPERVIEEIPEMAEEENSAVYVQKLLRAYSEHTGQNYKKIEDIETNEEVKQHFSRARMQFFCAEALRNFSRDNLPEGSFEELQNQFYDGVIDIVQDAHANGFVRVRKTVSEANKLQITNHPLITRVETKDRGGICHQLADGNRIDWTSKK